MEMIDRLLEHDRWATVQLLEACQGLTGAQLDQEFDIGHRTLRATLDHAFFNVEAWARLMAGQPTDDIERDSHSLASLSQRHERTYALFAKLARRLRDEQRLDDTFGDDFGGRMTVGGGIVHVVLHNAEHRGEVLHILQRLGVQGLPEIDHGLWDQTARTAWPGARGDELREALEGKAMKTRDELIKDIHNERAAWQALLAEVGEDRMEEPGPMGDWTFKDLAAHLLFWQERTIARMVAGPGGKPPAPWPASLGDEDEVENWEEINAWIREQHRDRPLRDVLADVERSYERFARLIVTMPEDALMTPGHFEEMGDKALVDANFFGHLHEEHEPSLREWLRTR